MKTSQFEKLRGEDMAPPESGRLSGKDRWIWLIALGSVAAVASLGGYLFGLDERGVKPVVQAEEVLPIRKDLGGSGEYTTHDGPTWSALRQARNGDGDAQYSVARWYLTNRAEEPSGMRWMMKAARNGHPQAVGWMSYLYSEGRNRPVDRIRASAWSKIAADIGAPVPNGSQIRSYWSGFTEADRSRVDIVYKTFAVEVRENYLRRR